MARWITPILLSLAVFAVPANAAEDQDDAIDPQAVEIVMNSAKFLASQPAFSLGWFISYDEIADGGATITYVRSGTTSMVRGKGFVSHTERDDTLRDYYWNGSVFTVVSPNEEFYSSAEFSGDYDALVDAVREKTGSVLPMWSIFSKNLPDDVMTGVTGAAYLGTTLLAGQSADHVIFTQDDEDWQIWISTDEDAPLPLMLVGTEKNKDGSPQYRVFMTDWNLEPDTDPAQFTYEPDENAVKLALPSLGAMTKPSEE
jgi:hypothetical protein